MRPFITACLYLVLTIVATTVSAKIVFTSSRDGIFGIYVMDDNGSNVMLLTDKLKPTAPRWSPDGKQIVFERRVFLNNSQRLHLFIMNADGTNIRQLTPPISGRDKHASFSPDGDSIVFYRYQSINDGNRSSIHVINLESGEVKKIAEIGVNGPDWSPDGQHIIFSPITSFVEGGGNIWIMEADGDKQRKLLTPPLNNELGIDRVLARWSPDGKQVLFLQYEYDFGVIDGIGRRIPHAYRFFIYDLKNKKTQKLQIPEHYKTAGLDWMDDGKSVVFSAVQTKLKEPGDGTPNIYNIYKYNIKSGSITRLTDHAGKDYDLDWISDHTHAVSPSGKKTIQWGQLKAFLYTRYKTLKLFSSELSDFFLQH